MQNYEFEYNGYTINFLNGAGSIATSDCSTSRNKNIVAVQRIDGFTSPEARHSQSDIAGNHGFVDHLSYLGGRIISLEGIIHGQNEVDVLEMIEDLCFYWNLPDIPAPDNTGYSRLTFTKDAELSKFVYAKIHSLPKVDRKMHSRNTYSFQVQFRCQDPRIYSTIEKTETLEKAVLKSGFPTLFPHLFGVGGYYSEEEIANQGNWAAPLSYTITNIGVDDVNVPRLANVTRGTYQEFNTTIAPGGTITVDTIAGTAVDQDGNNVLQYETADSGWLYIGARQKETFRLTSDSGTPQVVINWRDTWISAPR